MDPNTIRAASAAGLSLKLHASRQLGREILERDGADLVLTMTRAQLRDVIAFDPAWWSRTFTLKEIVRRASAVPPASPGEEVDAWLRRVAAGRRAAAMMKPDPTDDIDDPYGGPRPAHDAMVRELSELVGALLRLGPWQPASRSA